MISTHPTLRSLLTLLLAATSACTIDDAVPPDLLEEGEVLPGGKADDPSWLRSGTFHVGEAQNNLGFQPGSRRIFEFFVGGSADEPIDLVFRGRSGIAPIRIGILGPLNADGTRDSIAWDGYDKATHEPVVHATLARHGQYLLAVATHDMAYQAWDVSVEAECEGGACDLVGAIESPALGALLTSRTATFELNPWLGAQIVEVYRRPEGRYGEPVLIESQQAVDPGTGGRATVTIPDDVPEGTEIIVKVQSVAFADRLYDDGVEYTLWTRGGTGIDELNPIGMSDHGDVLTASGVAALWEGSASIILFDETLDRQLGQEWVTATLPGHDPVGLTSFAADIDVDWSTGLRHGDLLSIGHLIEGIGGYRPWACFQFCRSMIGGAADPACSSELVACD